MIFPIELLAVFAAAGFVSCCCVILWSAPQLWYRIKHKRFQPSQEELELKHFKALQEIKLANLSKMLTDEQARYNELVANQKETIDKIVSKL